MSLQPQMLDAIKVRGEYYKIKILSAELDSALEQLATTQTHDRSVLATQNMSHRKSVRGSMLVVRQNDDHPTVVLFNDAGEYTPRFGTKRACLIIENAESFLFYKDTFRNLAKREDVLDLDEIDIYYAAGNSINNRLHAPLLKQYEVIYLALDIDLGGLKIAQTLKKTYGNEDVVFLLPNKLEDRLEKVVQEKSVEYLEKVEKVKISTPSLETPCNLILRSRKTLEQNYTT